MKRFVFLTLALASIVFCGANLNAQDDRFTLDVISTDVENGGVVTGAPGATVTVHLQVQLTTTEAGVAGVVLPLGGEGADVSFVTPGCDSTCANGLYWEGANNLFFYSLEGRDTVDPTFENTAGALAGAGPQGAGMILGLTTNIITAFSYPAGTFTVADIDVEVTIPTGEDPETVTIDVKNGLKGSGVPQNLTITFNSGSESANVNGLTFDVVQTPPELYLSMNAPGAVDGNLTIPSPLGESGEGTVYVMLDSRLDGEEGVAGFQISLGYSDEIDVTSACVADQVFEVNPSLGGQQCPQSLQWTDENNAVDPGLIFESEDPDCELEVGAAQGKGISGGAILSGIPPGAGEFLPGNTDGPIRLLKIDIAQSTPFENADDADQVGTFTWKDCIKGLGVAAKTKLTVEGQSLDALERTGMTITFTPVSTADFQRGDSNSDGMVDLSDAMHIIDYQFFGGDAPACSDAADSNDDEKINIADVVHVISVLHRGLAPVAPGLDCGTDDDSTAESCPPGSTQCE